jgi:hypothetical protein
VRCVIKQHSVPFIPVPPCYSEEQRCLLTCRDLLRQRLVSACGALQPQLPCRCCVHDAEFCFPPCPRCSSKFGNGRFQTSEEKAKALGRLKA